MDQNSATIVIVEDDRDIRTLLADLLRSEGFTVQAAGNSSEMDSILVEHDPDLVILDIMLPGEDGLSICRRLRATRLVPILMLTAKGREVDQVIGLEMGADDYVVKPFAPLEMIARVRALLRRASMAPAQINADQKQYRFDRFRIDLDARHLEDDRGVALDLTSGEFDLLACFIERPRRVLTRDQLIDWTRGRQADPYDRTIDVLISRLRRKLSAASPGSKLIATVRNSGYVFTAPVTRGFA